jgi:hypothetical protein
MAHIMTGLKRAAKCCLLVYIDDATGKLLHLRFCEAETTLTICFQPEPTLNNTANLWPFIATTLGIQSESKSSQDSQITQFGRILNELNIDIIFANSPQAKGRVERANRTLQTVLIKEMRLEGIVRLPKPMHGYPALLSSSIRSSPNVRETQRIYGH